MYNFYSPKNTSREGIEWFFKLIKKDKNEMTKLYKRKRLALIKVFKV